MFRGKKADLDEYLELIEIRYDHVTHLVHFHCTFMSGILEDSISLK